jgi:hypothetical protein
MPRRLLFPAILASAFFVAGCATTRTGTFVATPFDGGRYFTYDWGARDGLPTGDARLDDNAVFQDYVTGAIDGGLADKGLVRRESKAPADLLVHYHATVERRTVVRAPARGDFAHLSDAQAPHLEPFDAGTLIVDLVDARTRKLVWRGWIEDTLDGWLHDQEHLKRQVDVSIARLMTRLPIGRN